MRLNDWKDPEEKETDAPPSKRIALVELASDKVDSLIEEAGVKNPEPLKKAIRLLVEECMAGKAEESEDADDGE